MSTKRPARSPAISLQSSRNPRKDSSGDDPRSDHRAERARRYNRDNGLRGNYRRRLPAELRQKGIRQRDDGGCSP
eukprot:8209656-Lingulodinium_polyedra.AAC.1